MIHSREPRSSSWMILNHPLSLLMTGAAVSLYLGNFRFPLIPIWVGTDQFGFIVMAERLWEGERFYRDFYYVTPPGHEVVYLVFFRLFGLRDWIPNADLVLIGLILTWLTAYIGRKMIRMGRFLPLLPAALFVAFSFSRVVQDSHRWFSSAGSLAALAVALEERTPRRLAIAGGLCGIASFFTQTQGVFVMAGFFIFLILEKYIRKAGWHKLPRQMACLLISFIVTVFVTDSFFVWKAGFKAFFNWIVVYPASDFQLDRIGGSFQAYLADIPRGDSLISSLRGLGPYLFIFSVVPFIYFAFLIWYWRRGAPNEDGLQAILVNLVGLCLFAGVARSPSYFRLCTISMPALIVLVFLLQNRRLAFRAAIAFLWMASLFSLVHRPILAQTSIGSVLQLPRGPIAFSKAILSNTRCLIG